MTSSSGGSSHDRDDSLHDIDAGIEEGNKGAATAAVTTAATTVSA
eukprot:CAMPEP_0170967666 /NCGR_PEP_ID=MMETSP0735-20130129/42749_1 /TAXON_ID=186038 /ORGANISM="Fragilariopsis kerguelensis, Strain L26-C5" /LENGTH=44 /DNA_ID= /DNA_START= /DNA_END= /DNA_ORIENTATION=